MPNDRSLFMCKLPRYLKLLFIFTMGLLFLRLSTPAHALPQLTIDLVTWHVIGLDSNNVAAGPNTYPVGARVCNEGTTTATNVQTEFVWDSANQYINLQGATSLSTDALAPGACQDFYYTVAVTRDPAAYFTARRFHIEVVSDEVSVPVTTPIPRELYVEKLVSQNRNDVISITGPSTLYLGGTYQFELFSKTATNGYEQLTTFLTFPNTMFEILNIDTTYSAPAGATNDKIYADACTWDSVPTSPTYRSCLGTGKAGGDIHTVYTVRIIGTGSGSMTNLIYDFSGSSYHYNADYGVAPDNVFNFTTLSPLNTTKADALVVDADGSGGASPGDTLEYTIRLENIGDQPITNVTFTDAPDPNTSLVVGSVATTLGSVTSGNTAGDTSVSVNVGDIPAGQVATITFRVLINDPLPEGTTQVANQGVVNADYLPESLTDDPSTATVGDPTITDVAIPTAIQLASFQALQADEHVEINWLTSAEYDTWGYHIYRSTSPDLSSAQRMTAEPILADGQGSGGMYEWVDYNTKLGTTYYYWLQEVEVNGGTREYGPANVSLRSNHYRLFMPFVRD